MFSRDTFQTAARARLASLRRSGVLHQMRTARELAGSFIGYGAHDTKQHKILTLRSGKHPGRDGAQCYRWSGQTTIEA
jgi:hypothetical protein